MSTQHRSHGFKNIRIKSFDALCNLKQKCESNARSNFSFIFLLWPPKICINYVMILAAKERGTHHWDTPFQFQRPPHVFTCHEPTT